jgi:Holliday junction resolvase-like predicted endonuclease
MFPDIVDIQERLLTKIINDIKKIKNIKINFNPEVEVHNQLKTIINQTYINAIQGITEGGYCQMISLLQAYLFLNYGNNTIFTPNGQTPLGSVIGESSPSVANGSSPLAEFQLDVIRGFVIHIGHLINQIFAPIGIDVSITTLSHIQHLYDQQPGAPPIYLIYIDALVKYVGEQIRTHRIIPIDIETDIKAITAESRIVDASTLNDLEETAMRLLTRLPNGEFDLLAREKQRILSAATVRDAAAAKKRRKGGKIKTKKQRKTKKRRKTMKQKEGQRK